MSATHSSATTSVIGGRQPRGPIWEEGHGMENIDSGHSSSQLDDRSGRHHCNLARLLAHELTRPNSNPATAYVRANSAASSSVRTVPAHSSRQFARLLVSFSSWRTRPRRVD